MLLHGPHCSWRLLLCWLREKRKKEKKKRERKIVQMHPVIDWVLHHIPSFHHSWVPKQCCQPTPGCFTKLILPIGHAPSYPQCTSTKPKQPTRCAPFFSQCTVTKEHFNIPPSNTGGTSRIAAFTIIFNFNRMVNATIRLVPPSYLPPFSWCSSTTHLSSL